VWGTGQPQLHREGGKKPTKVDHRKAKKTWGGGGGKRVGTKGKRTAMQGGGGDPVGQILGDK